MKISELVVGEKINDVCLVLKNIAQRGDTYGIILKDKSGEVSALCRAELVTESVLSNIGGVVKITAVVKPGKDRKPELVIKQIAKANKGEYKSSDLYDGLSEEKIAEYTEMITSMKRYVHHEGFRALLDIALNEETLSLLASMPATLGYYGRYKGGALAGAALVTQFVKDCGCDYVKHFNALHQGNINWSLLITAALLNTYGVVDYLTREEPFRKTPTGVERGYYSVLQSRIERLVIENNLPIADEELSQLLNVLAASVSSHTSVKATSKEGILLRHLLALYSELDMLDFGVEKDKTEDADELGYFYNSVLRRYISA